MAWRRLTDVQWARLVAEQLPAHPPSPRSGLSRVDDWKCFEGILWILWTGVPWSELELGTHNLLSAGNQLNRA